MKKIYYHIFLLMSLACIVCGCNILDIKPDGRETLDEIFADNDKTAAYLNALYGSIPEKGVSYNWVNNAPAGLCDEGWLVYKNTLQSITSHLYMGTGSASSHPLRDEGDYYARYLFQIRQCIIFLSRIGTANVTSAKDRSRWTAEAHVLKAYYMSEMVKWFGAFGYEPDGFPNDYDYSAMKKPSVWKLAGEIAKECDAALACDDLPWVIDNTQERLRATKALAWAIKSKMYLFAASPVHSEDYDDLDKQDHWQKAYEVNKEAVEQLESHGYALKTTIADNDVYSGPAGAYHELFSSPNLDTSTDKETIWQRTDKLNLLSHNYIGSYSNLENANLPGVVPSQELVDAYDVLSSDGLTAEPLLDVLHPYTQDKAPNYNPAALALGYDPADPYAARRDPRLDVTVLKNGDKVNWNGAQVEIETYEGGDNGISFDTEENRFTRTGYYFHKYIAPDADCMNNKAGGSWKYFRLAEVKLNYAEAAAESGKLDEALAQVNEVRARVSMPAVPSGLDKAEVIARVRNERMVELSYEEVRYFDVRRWGEQFESSELYKEFKLRCNKITAMYITKDPDTGTLTYERRVGDMVDGATKPRDLLLPYPETEAQTLFNLTGRRWQNTGW